MNKQKQRQNADGIHASANAITETMTQPGFTAEQLPELWQQITEPDQKSLARDRRDQWIHGIDEMYLRCETYPQHAKISTILSGMPDNAWHDTGWFMAQGNALLEQATPEQLRQALAHEQQHPEEGWWQASVHILAGATDEQMTGPVIEQLGWQDWFRIVHATSPGHQHYALDDAKNRRARHIVEHIQRRLHSGNSNGWDVFLGIVERGDIIGDIVELAKTIEQNRPLTVRKEN